MEPTTNTTAETNTQPTTPEINKTETTVNNNLQINPEWVITLLFVIFFGVIGVHRFYNRKIGTGILMILTLGGFGIWSLIDLIIILVGRFTDKDGNVIPIRIKA